MLYAVVPFRSDNAKLPAKAREAVKNVFELYAPNIWFVEFGGTAYELTDLIWPDNEEKSSPLGSGIIIRVENHNGYAVNALWEWLKAHAK